MKTLTFVPNESASSIFYTKETDGGGSWFGQEYIDIIKHRYPTKVFNNCYEWCSGPGFIGYSILANNLCNNLWLTDIYYPAILLAKETALHSTNKWNNNVTIYLLEDLALLPTTAMFDLIVSNPPHFVDTVSEDSNRNRICTDLNWTAHKNFFANIKSHLSKDGIILLQENMLGSTIESFSPFIEAAGLKITDWFKSDNWFKEDSRPQIYYIEIMHNENILR